MTDDDIIKELVSIRNRFSTIITELKKKNGIVSTPILDLLDEINKYSVEI